MRPSPPNVREKAPAGAPGKPAGPVVAAPHRLSANQSARWLLTASLTALLIAALASALIAASLNIQAGATAYIAGEGHWSKGQQHSVHHLYRYSVSGSPDDLQRAMAALDVPLGVRDARLALEQSPPNLEQASAGFARGRNHPDEIPSMI